MKKIIFGAVLIMLILFLTWNPFKKEKNILYSWSMDALVDNELEPILKQHQIQSLYQDFSSAYLKGTDSEFIARMNKLGIDVYHLSGDPSWGEEKSAKHMKDEIDKVVAYNMNNKEKIAGIVFDIEPYLNNEENFDFPLYVEVMKKAYQYAKSKDVYMILAIAVWFDTIDENLLEELIRDGSDEVSLMNYNIKYTKERIQEEVAFAMKYKKNINTIYEIDFGKDGFFPSYQAIDRDFNSLKKYYNYSKLKKAYHYYAKMK